MALPSFDEQVASMDSRLLDTASGFGVDAIVELKAGMIRPVSVVLDLESKSFDSPVGSGRAVVGQADLSDVDANGLERGDKLVVSGVRYEIVGQPQMVDSNLYRLILAVTNEQPSEQPDIRY